MGIGIIFFILIFYVFGGTFGYKIKESELRGKYGMIELFNSEPDIRIKEGDILILLGEKEGFEKLLS